MKNIITLLFAFTLFANGLSAQTKRTDTIANGKMNRQINTYDIHNNIASTTYQIMKDTVWVNDYNVIGKTYNSRHQITSTTGQRWQCDQWLNFNRESTSYNDTGKRTSLLEERWVNNAWVNFMFTSYSDTCNLSQTWYMGHWENNERDIFMFDTIQSRKIWVRQQWAGGRWVNIFPGRHRHGRGLHESPMNNEL